MFKRYNITLKEFCMEDHPDYEISVEKEIEPCLEFIQLGMAKSPAATLVICTAGMSRSATVCIAYLMKHWQMSYQRAFDTVRKARAYIRPNAGFVKFLKEYEKILMAASAPVPASTSRLTPTKQGINT